MSNKPAKTLMSHPVIPASDQRRLVSAEVVEASLGIKRGTLYRMVRERVVGCYRRGAKQRGLLFSIDEVLASLHQPARTSPPPTGDEAA